MSNFKKKAGYSITGASALASVALLVDRYGELAAGSESLMSWALPPVAMLAVAVTALTAVKLGYPSESENDA